MQILYLMTMAAIFILCLALFITSRRILRSTPLQGGELGLSHFNRVTQAPRESGEMGRPQRLFESSREANEAPETVYAEEDRVEERVARNSFHEGSKAHEISAKAQPMQVESVETDDVSAPGSVNGSQDFIEEEIETEPTPTRRKRRSTPTYAYVMEALLIGVSVVVLVRTQRSNSRARRQMASRGQVA